MNAAVKAVETYPQADGGQDPASLKRRLVQHLAKGDQLGAEETRRQLELVRLQRRVDEVPTRPAEPGASTASWIGEDGKEESIVMEATPEAREFFARKAEEEKPRR